MNLIKQGFVQYQTFRPNATARLGWLWTGDAAKEKGAMNSGDKAFVAWPCTRGKWKCQQFAEVD